MNETLGLKPALIPQASMYVAFHWGIVLQYLSPPLIHFVNYGKICEENYCVPLALIGLIQNCFSYLTILNTCCWPRAETQKFSHPLFA